MASGLPKLPTSAPSSVEATALAYSIGSLQAVQVRRLVLKGSATATGSMTVLDPAPVQHLLVLTDSRLAMDSARMTAFVPSFVRLFVPSLFLAPIPYWLVVTEWQKVRSCPKLLG